MPNDIVSNFRIRRENERIFAGTSELQELSGVQSASFSYSSQLFNSKTLGSKNNRLIKTYSGPKIGSASLDSIITSEDFFLQFTGENPTNIFLVNEKNSSEAFQSFYSGYLVSHSVSCSINSFATSNSTFEIVGDIGNIDTEDNNILLNAINFINSGDTSGPDFKIPTYGSIDVNFDDFSSDRVQSFDIQYTINRNYRYGVGESFGASHVPFSIKTNYPIEVDVSISLELDQYSGRHLAESLCNNNFSNSSIVLRDCEDDSEIARYSFENIYFVAENLSLDVENNLVAELNYKAWIFQ